MKRRTIWGLVFLPVTALAVAGELWAGLDDDPGTVPWTDYIVHNIPWPVTAAAIAILVCWLPWHFWQHYKNKKLENK
jgi:hypothetical protein